MSQDTLVSIVAELREDEALQLVKNMLTAGENPLMILEACRKAVEIVGERFEKAEYFLPDLIMAGEILKEITELVKPKMEMIDEVKRLGKIVIGTVQGDIHDIGKDVVTFMLDANGFDVYDLGIDVPPQAFVEKIREVKPEVVALSGLLTLAFDAMKATIDAITLADLRDHVKIMIGGSQVDERIKEYTKADAYGSDAMAAVSLAKEWVGGT
ncbi:MAG: cobalamin-dependent protein [Candidatus Bathyarchaeia archaeon]